ncbi:unnamed protein product [Lactuca saligna]|uniref:Uncharacterized protein n=1 Tax=Lactuca saligna TaxID=75948 RepID=A0AA36EP25_LACSI|nr:unnamed protein product [Lactuca saligna]
MATRKQLMALGDDDDVVVDDTPPNSPGDNPPPPPPPSTNLPPPPPPPSHPPRRTPSPPPNSLPQYDAANRGRIIKGILSQYTSDQSKTDDYEGFLDVGFMQQAIVPDVPLNVVYPGACVEGEASQKTKEEVLNESIVALILMMMSNSFLESGRLPSQGELLTLNLEVTLRLVIL